MAYTLKGNVSKCRYFQSQIGWSFNFRANKNVYITLDHWSDTISFGDPSF